MFFSFIIKLHEAKYLEPHKPKPNELALVLIFTENAPTFLAQLTNVI